MNARINNNYNNNNQTARRIPKCVSCEKAGLTGKALEHFTRKTADPNSEIICPTILAFKCGYCGNAGHSRGFCQAFKDNQAREERERIRRAQEDEHRRNQRRIEEERQREETSRRLKSNIFTAFNDDNDESDNDDVKINKHEQKHEIVEQVYLKNVKEVENEFPSLSKKTIKQQAPVIHFATVAKNAQYLPVPEVKILPIEKETFDDYDDDSDNNDDDDYTPYVPDDSFDNYDPYERPAHAFKYYTEEHELQANIVSNRRIIVEDDDNW